MALTSHTKIHLLAQHLAYLHGCASHPSTAFCRSCEHRARQLFDELTRSPVPA